LRIGWCPVAKLMMLRRRTLESNPALGVDSFVVWTAMHRGRAHLSEHVGIKPRIAFKLHDSNNSAHRFPPARLRNPAVWLEYMQLEPDYDPQFCGDCLLWN